MAPSVGGPHPAVDWRPWLEHPSSAGLAVDYDGTLAQVVDDPSKAKPLPGAAALLRELSARLAMVAVISGRPLSFLSAQLGEVEGLQLIGLYGLETNLPYGTGPVLPSGTNFPSGTSLPSGTNFPSGTSGKWQDVIDRLAETARREAPAGVEVERKAMSMVLHARERPEMLGWARRWATDHAAAVGLSAQPGRMSVELLAAGHKDKGQVVRELAAPLNAMCFIGDDEGDMPAFAALRTLREEGKRTLAVGVASPEQPEGLAAAVDIVVAGPQEALELIGRLVTHTL